MKTSSAWKMTLLSIKSEAWAYSLITLGTEMLSSFFSFYYVKLFLDVYKISELAFYQSQCLVLLGQSWLKKYGYYKVILISFYLEGAAALVMLLLGLEHYYCLAVYLTVIMVIVHASFCLFNLPVADMVDVDLLKFNGQSSLSLMVSVISVLFTRPAQSLAPMLILSKLSQHGYGELSNSILLDLQDSMFSLVCVVSLGIATVQILTWSSFSSRDRRDCSGVV